MWVSNGLMENGSEQEMTEYVVKGLIGFVIIINAAYFGRDVIQYLRKKINERKYERELGL